MLKTYKNIPCIFLKQDMIFFNEKLDRMQTQNFYLFILYIYFCIFVSPHLEKKKKLKTSQKVCQTHP